MSDAADSSPDDYIEVEFLRPDAESDYWPYRIDPLDFSYRAGLYGRADGRQAELAFLCGKGMRKNGPPAVIGFLRLGEKGAAAELPDGERARAAMVMLLSASRAVAAELGCLAESGLPAELPEPQPYTAYRRPPSLKALEKDFTGREPAGGAPKGASGDT
ncbi:hypothetical protein AB0E74_14500 [Streptomyces sp. NPDC030392]|uniref:hypothetical protein n=1 Tax=Streptomyces sp. NPDC030392 TaxID=3155468 RepID=UPI0033D0F67E